MPSNKDLHLEMLEQSEAAQIAAERGDFRVTKDWHSLWKALKEEVESLEQKAFIAGFACGKGYAGSPVAIADPVKTYCEQWLEERNSDEEE